MPLQLICNKSIECGQYPNGIKIAKVVAIYKKGMMHIADNYRPISLLSGFNKMFEKLIHKNLMKFIDKHNIVFMYQFGYRKLHSTTLALIEITDKIKKWLDEGNYVLGIYIDLTKAFDTVDYDILFWKVNQYGIRGHANDFFVFIWRTGHNIHVLTVCVPRPVNLYAVFHKASCWPIILYPIHERYYQCRWRK